jgi:hypothetical protein
VGRGKKLETYHPLTYIKCKQCWKKKKEKKGRRMVMKKRRGCRTGGGCRKISQVNISFHKAQNSSLLYREGSRPVT